MIGMRSAVHSSSQWRSARRLPCPLLCGLLCLIEVPPRPGVSMEKPPAIYCVDFLDTPTR